MYFTLFEIENRCVARAIKRGKRQTKADLMKHRKLLIYIPKSKMIDLDEDKEN